MKKALVVVISLLVMPMVLGATVCAHVPIELDAKGPVILTEPVSTYWHEISPVPSRLYHLNSWVDNGDGKLSVSDQIDLKDEAGKIIWCHVEWIRDPIIPNDGIPDLRVWDKSVTVPEFPLGIEVLLALAPMIAIAYLTLKKPAKKL